MSYRDKINAIPAHRLIESALVVAGEADAEIARLQAEVDGLVASVDYTSRQLQKAINGNQMDDEWLMAETQARALIQMARGGQAKEEGERTI